MLLIRITNATHKLCKMLKLSILPLLKSLQPQFFKLCNSVQIEHSLANATWGCRNNVGLFQIFKGSRGIMRVFNYALAFLFCFSTSSEAIETPRIPDAVFEVFHTKIRPHMMSAYKSYQENVGEGVSEQFYNAYEYLAPHANHVIENNQTFFRSQNPELYDDFARVPTPLKIAHEKFLFTLWAGLSKFSNTKEISKLDCKFEKPSKMVFQAYQAKTGKTKVPAAEQARLERLLNDLRDYAPDKEMRNCFRVYGVPSDIINAINVGCSIFVNTALYNILSDDEVRAVLSHEISHGSNGDGLKTMGHLVKSILAHAGTLAAESAIWILTDEEMEYLTEYFSIASETKNQCENKKSSQLVTRVGSQAPALELRADILGAQLLNSAGYSAKPMLSALTKLHDAAMAKKKKENDTKKSVRNYPSLEKRLDAIRGAMEF